MFKSFRSKVITLTCSLVFMTALVVGSISYYQIVRTSQNAAIEFLAGETRLTALKFKDAYDTMRNDAHVVSRTPPFQGLIRSLNNSDIDPLDGSTTALWRTRLETIFTSLMQDRPYYTQVRYIGLQNNGRELVRVNRLQDGFERVAVENLQEKSLEPYFKRGITLKPDEFSFSEVSYNREEGRVDDTLTPTVRLVLPIYDENTELFGLMVINADYAKLLEYQLNKISPNKETYVVNHMGDYMAYDPGTGALPFEFHEQYSKERPQFIKAILTLDKDEDVFIENHYIDYFIRYQTDPVNKDSYLGVVLRVPESVLMQGAHEARNQAFIVSAILVICASFISVFIARSFTAPLQNMTNSIVLAERSKDKGMKLNLPTERGDEFGKLARAFDRLTSKLRNSEQEVHDILTNANDGIITFDIDGTIRSFNPACQKMFGYTENEIIGENIKCLLPETIWPDYERYINQYMHSSEKDVLGLGREIDGRHKNGSIFPMDLSVSESVINGQRVFTGIARDVTERKNAEAQIKSAFDFQNLIKNSIPDILFVKDKDFKIVQANDAFLSLYPGYLRDNILGTTTLEKYKEEEAEEFLKYDKIAFKEGYSETEEVVTFPNGERRTLLTKKVRFEDIHRDEFILGISRDITVIKEANAERERLILKLKESNEDLDSFAYVASHDLKAPLRVIDNTSRWLEEDLEQYLDEDSKENMEMLRNRVSRMERLLDDLLEYSRVGKKLGETYEEPVNAREMIDDVLALLSPGEDFTINIADDFNTLEVMRMPLQQIFYNLINNAIKHHDKDHGIIDITMQDKNEFYEFTVADNGAGIPEEFQKQIFDLFQTLKPRDEVEGSGMGLAIIKKQVQSFGGQIYVNSTQGEGSKFIFTFKKKQGTLTEKGI